MPMVSSAIPYANRIPFYFFIKVAFLVWCYHPSTVVRSSSHCASWLLPYAAVTRTLCDAETNMMCELGCYASSQGSNVIYNTLIKPYVAPHVGTIDAAVKSATETAKKAL